MQSVTKQLPGSLSNWYIVSIADSFKEARKQEGFSQVQFFAKWNMSQKNHYIVTLTEKFLHTCVKTQQAPIVAIAERIWFIYHLWGKEN